MQDLSSNRKSHAKGINLAEDCHENIRHSHTDLIGPEKASFSLRMHKEFMSQCKMLVQFQKSLALLLKLSK